MDKWADDLTDEQKTYVMDLIITTVKEIREQIAADILYTEQVWQQYGKIKSRRTKKAFEVCAALARGENEFPV
jgi:hypothetical protein